MTRFTADLVATVAEAVDADLRAENELLRSILRKLKAEGDAHWEEYGPGKPERAGDRFLVLDYSTVDLTPAEATLYDAVVQGDQATSFPPCARCGHPNAWHRHDDTVDAGQHGHGSHGADLTEDPYTGCPFRCVGYDVWLAGSPPIDLCTCPDYLNPALDTSRTLPS